MTQKERSFHHIRTGHRDVESDRILIAKSLNGDSRAFGRLVRRYQDTVYKFAFKICRDERRAGETLQDTFIQVFRKLKTFDGKSKFSTWLYAVVTNSCRMSLRRTKQEGLTDLLDDVLGSEEGRTDRLAPRSEQTPADLLMRKELQEALDRAIARLEMPYRVVFVLRDLEGHSGEETAKILGISVEAAKSRLRRARAFLRDELAPFMEERKHAGTMR